ncbi:uncharacterized protein LOC5511079 [Nematostella vectensis]|uniref:uncharacterized protein LOC5511079 n=1 Tax=Nematostella vectensis TaxID=45351 RepID=UPI0020777895|nr:uncharacterized protein LOC5511079 [Nematostella vectensis]
MYRYLRSCRFASRAITSRYLQNRSATQVLTRKRFLSSKPEEDITNGSSQGNSFKSWRENPNLKYWIVGIATITGIIYRYVYKEREKSRIVVQGYPPLPNHKVQLRKVEIEELKVLHKALQRSGTAIIHLEGPSGYGKRQLARSFAEALAQKEGAHYHFLPHNLFIGTINSTSVETMLFDMKKFAIAIGCQAKDWVEKVDTGRQFVSLSSDEQLTLIVDAVKEKLVANPNWVLILEDLKERDLFEHLFGSEIMDSWGKGTIIVTHPGTYNSASSMVDNVYKLHKGLSKPDALQLLQDLSGLPEDRMGGAEELVGKLDNSPLAVSCAGNLINRRLKQNPEYSIKLLSKELEKSAENVKDHSSRTDNKVLTYAVAALLTKEVLAMSPHFLHAFNLIGTCSPDWPLPATLITLHLRAPEFMLPSVPRSGPILPGPAPDSTESHPEPEENVQESFLSIKRLAKNLESFTTAVKENYKAIMDIFYPPPFDMAPIGDGILDMLKTCPLISIARIDPGGIHTVRVNPIIHSVMSQLYLSITAPQLEEQHLKQAEEKHQNSSFFRRLWKFDPQRTLQEYRNGLVEQGSSTFDPQTDQQEQVFPHPDVSAIFRADTSTSMLPEYRAIKQHDAIHHNQRHTSRVLATISRTSSVCSQDIQTRTLARLLRPHLDHILAVSTPESLGNASRAHALSAIASINTAAGNLEASLPSLERALQIETQHFGESSLEVAATLTRMADVYSSLENPEKARGLLERAYNIYDLQRKKSGEYKKPLEFARTMEALGAVYGNLGFKQRSREYIERALSYMQSAAPPTPDEIEGRRFACEVASALADLGHAYLSCGDAFQGRKMLDLAVSGLKNMYGEEHPEVVRAMTVLGIAHTMQGNWQEGKKIRKEAGKLQAKLDAAVSL